MATTHYTIEEFVNDLRPIVDSESDIRRILDRGSSLLERLMKNPNSVPEQYRIPQAKEEGRTHVSMYLLHRESPTGISVSAVAWGPGAHATPHDHHTWGLIGVMDASTVETRYRRLDDGSKRGYAMLEKGSSRELKPGDISLLVEDEDEIHAMDNFNDRPSVELHVYGNEISGVERCRFDAENRSVEYWVMNKYANE